MPAATFQIETEVYEANRDAWLSQGYEGSFAVIKGNQVVTITRRYEDAIRDGIRKTRSRAFFIQRIQSKDTVEWLSHIQ